MARCFQRLQADPSERDGVPIGQRRERILRLRGGAQVDGGARPVAQLQMARHEVRVEMGEEHVRDPQPVLFGERQVLFHVALRVHDRGHARGFIAHEVGRVGETIEIELL